MAPAPKCPLCGNPLPSQAPLGLCSTCAKIVQENETDHAERRGEPEQPLGRTAVQSSDRSVKSQAWDDLCETVSYHSAKLSPPAKPTVSRGYGPTLFVDLDQLVRSLIRLELVEETGVQEFLERLPNDACPKRSEDLARDLVRSRRLTEYQAGALLQGKSKGLVIGNYLILDKIGAGGMGMVFRASHRRMKRVVALKVLPPSFAKNETAVLRFHREAEAAAKLSHPNVVSVLDADEFNGLHFFAMEYVEGRDLARLVADGGPLSPGRAVDCVVQAARGLGAAHAHGIYHRDIKPSNLLLDVHGTVKVLDLGLARMEKGVDLLGAAESDPELTRPGTLMGTVSFMPPEQAFNSRLADHRSDIYSLGCTLYYLLTGSPPYRGETPMACLIAHREQPIPRLSDARPGLPPPLDATLRRMMAKSPQDRYQSIDELVSDLHACQSSVLAGNGGPGPSATPADVDFEVAPAAKARSRPWIARMAAALVLSVILASLVIVVADRGRSQPRNLALTGDAPKPPAAVTPRVGIAGPPKSTPAAPLPPPPAPPEQEPEEAPEPMEPLGEVRRFAGHDKGSLVQSIAVATNDRHALSGGNDQTVRLWEVATGQELGRFIHGCPIFAVALSSDNRSALSGGRDGIVRLWDVEAARELGRFDGHKQAVISVAFSPDGRRFLSGSSDKSVLLRDLATRGVIGPPLLHDQAVTAVAFSPDGRPRAVSASVDKTIRYWDLDSAQQIHRLECEAKVLSVAVSPDGHRALSGGEDGSLTLWNLDSGQPVWSRPGKLDGVRSLCYLPPDGHHAISGTQAGTLILWEVEDEAGREIYRIDGTGVGRLGIAALSDGRHALTSDEDGFVRLWNFPAGR